MRKRLRKRLRWTVHIRAPSGKGHLRTIRRPRATAVRPDPPDRRGRRGGRLDRHRVACPLRHARRQPHGRRAGTTRGRRARLCHQHARAIAGGRHHRRDRAGGPRDRRPVLLRDRQRGAAGRGRGGAHGPDLPHRQGPGDRAPSGAHPGGAPGRRDPDRRIGVRRPGDRGAGARRAAALHRDGRAGRRDRPAPPAGRHRAARQHRGRTDGHRARPRPRAPPAGDPVRLARADHGHRSPGRRPRGDAGGRPRPRRRTGHRGRVHPRRRPGRRDPDPEGAPGHHRRRGAERRHGDRLPLRAAPGPDRGAGPDDGDRFRRRGRRRRPGARPDHDPAADVRHGRASAGPGAQGAREPAPEAAGARRARRARLVRPRSGAERRHEGRRRDRQVQGVPDRRRGRGVAGPWAASRGPRCRGGPGPGRGRRRRNAGRLRVRGVRAAPGHGVRAARRAGVDGVRPSR